MGILSGKKGVVFGVANKRSIAWAIAQAWKDEGAELAFTYQGEALGRRVHPLAAEVGSELASSHSMAASASLAARCSAATTAPLFWNPMATRPSTSSGSAGWSAVGRPLDETHS